MATERAAVSSSQSDRFIELLRRLRRLDHIVRLIGFSDFTIYARWRVLLDCR